MPRPATNNVYYELLWISEREIDELERNSSLFGHPMYVAVSPAGRVRTWPKFDPKTHRMFVKPWDGGK